MQPRFVALGLIATILVGCDAGATATGSTTPTVRPAASASGSVRAGTAAPASVAPAPTPEPPAPTPAPTTAPRTNAPPPPPPAAAAKVTVLPASSGQLGSTWLLTLSGFPPGRVVETITNPNGIPRSAFLTAGPDGSVSTTFQTTLSDQPGVGRYTFRFDSGPTSITTTIEVTRPQ
jgi:hypothetical protein